MPEIAPLRRETRSLPTQPATILAAGCDGYSSRIVVSRKGRTKPCTARTAINRTASPHFLQRGKRSRAVKVAWCIMRWSTCSMRYIPLFGTLSPGLYSAFFDTFFIRYTATWEIKMHSSRSLVACSSLKIVAVPGRSSPVLAYTSGLTGPSEGWFRLVFWIHFCCSGSLR